MPTYDYKCEFCGEIEIVHSIKDDAKTVCPECGKEGLERLITGGAHVIWKGKEANQYNDIKAAKYWRDKDGNRHKVTDSDGSPNAPTVSKKRKRTDEQAAAIKKRDAKIRKQNQRKASYQRFLKNVKRNSK